MSIFKKSRDKIEAEKLYALLSDKTTNYTLEDIKETIKKQGYSDKVSSIVVKMITDNKLPLKDSVNKTKTKEEVLKELSASVDKNFSKQNPKDSSKDSKKEDKNNQKENTKKQEDIKKEDSKKQKEDLKKTKETNLKNINKVPFFTKVKTFFKRIYFFFEDNYYKMVDGVSKVIPLNKLTDKIDKVFPSFILFLLILALLIYLILSGSLSFSKTWTVAVEVYDPSSVPLKDVSVTLMLKDENFSTLKTDIFGEVIFSDFKSRKQNINLIASKDNYDTVEHSFKLSKSNLRQKLYLPTDVNSKIDPSEEEVREISFVENNTVLITDSVLTTNFSCTNADVEPNPTRKVISSGKVTVTTYSGCGALRVSVTSDDFSSITNQVINSSNKVNLTRINLDRGNLGFSVKNISGSSIPGTEVKVYSSSNTTFPHDTTTTDLYGLGEFSLEPKSYFLTFSKEGYLTNPLKGPLTVIKNDSVNTDVVLFTLDDLLEFDCSDDKYSQFCIADEIDCFNPNLKPFLINNADGSCTIGRPGYISVTLKDVNSGEPVYADITLDSKLKESDQNFSLGEHIARDTNFYTFNVIDFYNYRVRVLNTEESGYLQPDPVTVNGIDQNITVNLEYSSSLNSGDISVNVKSADMPISNARVYLYKEFEDDFVLVNSDPLFTNQNGDVNFYSQRANRDYYAYALHNVLDKQGTSQTDDLDVNSILDLSIDLEDIPKILNLKVSPSISYDINFYNSSDNLVTEYVRTDLEDGNSLYYFTGSINKVYAVVSSSGYTTYQTDYITLIPDQEVYKTVNLSTLSSCEDSKLEILGLYDGSGVLEIDNIDFVENDLDKEYRLKFKYISCTEDEEYNQATLRLGRQGLIDDEYLFFVSDQFTSQDIDVTRGYKFSQEHIPDFNFDLFNLNYSQDRSYDYSGEGYKWIEIDFEKLNSDILEFSTNFKFREDSIVPFENYVLNYKSFASIYDELYSFDPVLNESWTEIPIYPNGYFYAETNKYLIPFENTDYIYSVKLKDWNQNLLEEYAGGYPVSINNFYKYDLSYLYLNQTERNGSVLQSSQYTNNNLDYLSYGYTSSLGNSSSGDTQNATNNMTSFLILPDYNTLPGSTDTTINQEIYYHINVDDYNYSLDDINAEIGYYLNTYTLLEPKGFFENTNFSDSSIISDVLDEYPLVNTSIYSYLSDENFIFNISTNFSGNRIIIGENNLGFKVLDNYGSPVSNVLIKYKVDGDELITLGSTNEQGMLSDQNIFINLSDIGKNINFVFLFSPEFGFLANTVVRNKEIYSGFSIVPEDINLSASYYILNDQVIIDQVSTNNYNLLKETNYSSTLEEIDFVGESSLFNLDSIKNKMIEDNNLVKDLLEGENEIITSLFLNNNISQSTNLLGYYRNEIDINNSLTQLLDINSNVEIINLGSINYDFNLEKHFMKGLLIENNNVSLELIKEINELITLDLNLLSDNSQATFDSISVELPEFLDLEEFNEGYSSLVGESLTSDGLIIPLNFKINNSYSGSLPTPKEDINLTFNVYLDDKLVSFNKIISIKVYSKDDIFLIESEGDLQIYCTVENCSQNKSYKLKKLIKNYILNLNKEIEINEMDLIEVSNLLSNINFIDLSEKNRALSFSALYNSVNEENKQGNFDLIFNINILNDSFNIEIPIDYLIIKYLEEETISEITFNSCIGVGGQESSSDLFILGYCQDTQDTCKTGESAVPKVFFNWAESDLSTDYDGKTWNNVCIGNSQDTMSSKYACDSLQMLISIFNKIDNGVEESFYIKLLNDGISDALLKDFINYNTLYLGYDKPSEEIFSEDAVDDGLFKITINNSPEIKIFQPGIYKVLVYGDDSGNAYMGREEDQMIDIRLEKVSDLPASEISVFHYMPFNGNLGLDGTREGYGIKNQDSDVAQLTQDVDINYIDVIDEIIQLSLTNNNLETSHLTQTLKSEGKILELNKYDSVVEMIYSPSYPVPIYSHVACIDKDDFSYNLYENNNALDNIIGGSFIDWNFNNTIRSDVKTTVTGDVTRYVFNNNNLEGSLNLNSMLYLPVKLNIDSLKLKTTEFANNKNTTLFTKNNFTGVNQADLVFSEDDYVLGNDLINLNTIKGLFNFISQEKACIEKSIDNTTIKWIDEKVNFTEQELLDINSNIPSDYSCLEGEVIID